MRNSTNAMMTPADRSADNADNEETTWSLPGGIIGFVSWLLALFIPFYLYGSNTLFLFLYTWPFFLALAPIAVVVGIAIYSLVGGRLIMSCCATLMTVVAMLGLLFMWLMG